ncbi:hypothetical protein HMI01_14740 [Halolactibacillus miurensis]|uniref:Uncharacterized protein n=1 Tax=Halolactibacillus miurensis TaxID=306541 RepID=A0A1I6S1Q4_9BACI|nr:hypothetical protein [Halolactibacillus miurensis]GEM04486.1 hypothetical protein HMI01_14740 [Halolactibacillus miurensis]SFS70905.1 hypothetical protein SAMN05421668_10786 [Halolactibacillus miurensis]
MNKNEIIMNQLINLRLESKSINSENDLRNLIDKYDMIFAGENSNKISSLELAHSLKLRNVLDIDHEEMLLLTPDICKELNMKYEPLYLLKDRSTLADYSIYLF